MVLGIYLVMEFTALIKGIRWEWYMAPALSFKEEVWINDSLVVRIRLWLFRFREYDIAFMAETESVFYQLMVFKEGRCCLKLLCWKDGNFGNTIIDCQMNVLVFCATFSPGYSNCTLKKAPTDYKMFLDYKFQKPYREISLLAIY